MGESHATTSRPGTAGPCHFSDYCNPSFCHWLRLDNATADFVFLRFFVRVVVRQLWKLLLQLRVVFQRIRLIGFRLRLFVLRIGLVLVRVREFFLWFGRIFLWFRCTHSCRH